MSLIATHGDRVSIYSSEKRSGIEAIDPKGLNLDGSIATGRSRVGLAAGVHPGFTVAVGEQAVLIHSMSQSACNRTIHHRAHLTHEIEIAGVVEVEAKRPHPPPGAVHTGVL